MTEEEGGKSITVLELRWRDCFKFWIAGFVLTTLPGLILLATAMAMFG